eukprot:scaffold4123_cov136-Isochrysis_galbana.AAC.1
MRRGSGQEGIDLAVGGRVNAIFAFGEGVVELVSVEWLNYGAEDAVVAGEGTVSPAIKEVRAIEEVGLGAGGEGGAGAVRCATPCAGAVKEEAGVGKEGESVPPSCFIFVVGEAKGGV